MKEHKREYPLFSACGLNCGLCPNHHTNGASRCAGCGGDGFFYPACPILACNARHGVQYCCLCGEYSCGRYAEAGVYDSFVTHRNQLKDNEKAKAGGIAAYRAELDEKVDILQFLLNHYNDGRRKNFFCLAVNLLDLPDIREVLRRLEAESPAANSPPKERAALAARLFQATAVQRGVELKLRKKPMG